MPSDYFVKIQGIKGESRDKAHKDEIDVMSISWGMQNRGGAHSGSGIGSGKVRVDDISFTEHLDKSTPDLMLACASGRHISDVKFTLRKSGEKPLEYFVITLNDVLVSSVNPTGSHGDDLPTESITLNFAKVKVEYKEQSDTGGAVGTSTMTWDVAANTNE